MPLPTVGGTMRRPRILVLALAAVALGLFLLLSRPTADVESAGLEAGREESAPPQVEAEAARDADSSTDRVSAGAGSAGSEPTALTVVVVDEQGSAVEAAAVHALDAEQHELVGITGADGAFVVSTGARAREHIGASRSGYEFSKLPWPPADQAELRIELRAATKLAGLVVKGDGSPAGPGIQVMAWGEDRQFEREIVRRVIACDPRYLGAVTDAEGRFAIEGVAPERLYYLAAGGMGYASPEYVVARPFTTAELRIEVHRVFATWLRLRERLGGELRTSEHLYGRKYGSLRFDAEGPIRRLSEGQPQAFLALGRLPETRTTLTDRFTLLTLPNDVAEAGPISFACSYPGYEPVNVEIMVPAFEGEPWPERIVELTPTTEGWSSITLNFGGNLVGRAQTELLEPLGLFRLSNEAGEVCEYAVRETFPASFEVRGIPRGEYAWEFEVPDTVPDNGFRFPSRGEPPIPIVVGDEPASVDVDLGALGAIDVRIVGPDGEAYSSYVKLKFRTVGSQNESSRLIRAAPYFLSGLHEGDYEVWLDEPRVLDRSTASSLLSLRSVDVHADEIAALDLRIPD